MKRPIELYILIIAIFGATIFLLIRLLGFL
jgi:hypothetical protein